MGQVPQIPGDIKNEDLINSTNKVIAEMNNRDTVQVFKDDSGTRRVILDKDGLRTSPEGIDVYTADNADLTFNSNNNVFKIVASGTITPPNVSFNTGGASYANATAIVQEAHGLGFAPAFIAFYEISGSYSLLPYTTENTLLSGGAGFYQSSLVFGVDETNIYATSSIWGYNSGGSATATWNNNTIKYYLLQETAN